MFALRQLGLVVHPTRRIDSVLDAISTWAAAHDVAVGQVPVAGQAREVAEAVDAGDCDLLLAVGGDGTALHALREGAAVSRPVLAVACGSIGMLTAVGAEGVVAALDQVAAGRFTAEPIPGLEVKCPDLPIGVAVNDVAVVRAGPGQIMVSIRVDDELYARAVGDGVVVASALGSSAYSMAAGGPILAAGVEGMVVTALESHGGCTPPLVVGPGAEVDLHIEPGYGGARLEFDGQIEDEQPTELRLARVEDHATLVALGDAESLIAGLRRRRILIDSPRVLARDDRKRLGDAS